jgi:hypothetical protein
VVEVPKDLAAAVDGAKAAAIVMRDTVLAHDHDQMAFFCPVSDHVVAKWIFLSVIAFSLLSF